MKQIAKLSTDPRVPQGSYHCEAELEPGDAKPCPFCGQDHDLELINTWTASYWMRCGCGAEMHGVHASHLEGFPDSGLFEGVSIDYHRGAHNAAAEYALQLWNERS